MPRNTAEIADLSPDERRTAVATILAQGVLRLRCYQAAVSRPDRTPENPSKDGSYSLEPGATPSPHAPTTSGGTNHQRGA